MSQNITQRRDMENLVKFWFLQIFYGLEYISMIQDAMIQWSKKLSSKNYKKS